MRKKTAFTLVELLVVIAIIGILIALLLPAVQSAREAARRLQCQNNLKQIGLALLNYESQWGSFPPGSHWASDADVDQKNNANLRENWVIMILPHLEQQSLYDTFDLDYPIPHDNNRTARGTRLSFMLCPTDAYNSTPFDGSGSSMTNQMGDGWARGNYAANGALGYCTYTHGGEISGLPADAALRDKGWADSRIRGVMGANAAVSTAQIRDGLSNTVLVAEIRAGVTSFDSRGVWAMSGGAPSGLWAHGYIGDDFGPNNSQSLKADDTMACTDIRAAVGGDAALAKMGMPCSDGNWWNFQQTARSMHVGGVHACLADGSVHWLSDSIEVTANNPNHASVWDRLMLSADGYPIAGNAF